MGSDTPDLHQRWASAFEALRKLPIEERVASWWAWHGNSLVKSLKDGTDDLAAVLVTVWLQEGRLAEQGEGYGLEESVAESLVSLALEDWTHHRLASRICAINVLAGMPLPDRLREFAAAMILGAIEEPRKRGRKPSQTFVRNLHLVYAIEVAKAHFIDPTRSDATSEDVPCGCALAIEALERAGLPQITYDAMKKVWIDRKKYLETIKKLNLRAATEARLSDN